MTRRNLLSLAARSAASGALLSVTKPAISRAGDRPQLTHGVQSGDVSHDGAMVWARADRPARMRVEVATSDSFQKIIGGTFIDALPETDFTAKALLEPLPAGQDIFYRICLQDLSYPKIIGEPCVGRFATAPLERRSVSFVWSGDTAGQGWGIDEARGGMRSYATMLANRPDFFIHSGDNIYADDPILAEQAMPNGEIWRNLVTEAKAKPAESLAEFRGNWKYNLLDRNLRQFNAQVPSLISWDDHDVTNNWWPGEPLERAEHRRKRYREPNALALAARALRAFHEFTPTRFCASEPGRIYRKVGYGPLLDVFILDMRSYRGPNGEDRQSAYGPPAYFLGPAQTAWLKAALKASQATWKVIAADMPLSLVVVYDTDRNWGIEAIGQGDPGPPLGRELEIADLLRFLQRSGIRNTVWLTADVHYTAAHYYDPNRAAFTDFDPFWEFVSGPLHAGTFGPNALDATFGPQVVFQKVPRPAQGQNLPPSYGMQFFGLVEIDGLTEVMTVTLKDVANQALWSIKLEPQPRAAPR